ncbi:hypothetical protein SISSUDRAFT_628664 [Sistotremastrum suecicum HHB10207 ss-3]|uniref:F-box domain-containing protein n=1 Tax=Sistotremastrum suecicum HHB10207 ss-3 TaxID=1314776 RepID=A0A166EG02_9AGAM|nr:hypothetical protein SISSUDRAFT_628664 [Sistotremastrum suecicum HHB10207 ss-3]
MIFPNLDNLAVELVIEILRGVDIQTITSIALTSSRLYHIVKSERKIWMDASDVLDLPLETGETLATTPVQSILALSMRAILIRNRLRNAKSIPRHYRKMHDKQTNFAQKLLPGGEWMISTQGDTSNLWLISLNNGDENSNSALLFVAPTSGVIKCYAFEALGKGQIHLAVGFTTYMTEGDVDYIALMHLQPTLRNPAKPARAEGKPLVTDIKYHLLPASPLSISLRKPLVLVHTSSENHNNFHGILFDDETEAGVLLEAEHPEIEHLLEPGAQRVDPPLFICLRLTNCFRAQCGTGKTLAYIQLCKSLYSDVPMTSIRSFFPPQYETSYCWRISQTFIIPTKLHPKLAFQTHSDRSKSFGLLIFILKINSPVKPSAELFLSPPATY